MDFIKKAILNLVPKSWVTPLIKRLVQTQLNRLDAKEGLCFLFDLDSFLYFNQTQKAIAYGNGIHPKHRHIKYHDFFIKHISHHDRVLDIGCGIGALAQDVAEKAGCQMVGIDLDEKNIEQAKQRFAHDGVDYRVGDAKHDLPDEQFDVIILSNVLEHLTDRSEFLKTIQERFQPDRFLIRVPLFEREWRVPLKKELETEWRLDRTHEIEYTQETFEEEIKAADLHIISKEVRWGEIWAVIKKNSTNHG